MDDMNVHAPLRIVTTDEAGTDLAFKRDVLAGLAQSPKAIPARWFYDLEGSRLFEAITALPEYYLTRTEVGLLEAHGREIAALTGPGRLVVEFGSGSSLKTPLVLREIEPAAYVPIDISGEFLNDAARELGARFPHLPVVPIEADFTAPIDLQGLLPDVPPLGFFPGSTIGNLTPATAVDCLRSMRETLGPAAQLLIGFDRTKPVATLVAAYDDAQGVTARFNLNLLDRINRELEADIPVEHFRHVARWNPDWNRIEMHLEALVEVNFTVCGRGFTLARGETIHTENSHKYTPGRASLLLQASGWSPLRTWTDADNAFLILLAEATEDRAAP
jgi:L-histidine Nalpha-methyltransferase